MTAPAIITSVLTGGTNTHTTVAEELNAYATDFVTQGILGSFTNTGGVAPMTGSFGVIQDSSPDMGITILGTGNTGSGQAIAYLTGQPSSQDTQVVRARMASNYTEYTINANSSGVTKYDFIYLQFSATNANAPDTAGDNVVSVYTSRSSSSSTDNGSPPTYGILLAVVTVANGASSITSANIQDRRSQVTLQIGSTSNTNGWNTLNYPLSYANNSGNKEFTVTSANNLTGILSPGMTLQIARSVTPPTQCMAFASASSQYAAKTSPSGISFTSAFTAEAWIYLNSITGQTQAIVSRINGAAATGGWSFEVDSTGRLRFQYGTTSSFTQFTSLEILPTGVWLHVAGVLTSASGKTGALYINGLLVPSFNPTSAATSLTQSTDPLCVGAYGTTPANTYFNGYISECRVWSVAQTQSSIQSNMAISVAGSATNLVALFQGNGAFTDGTSNANTLTAAAGAIATQANNPYNAIEYAYIIAISYSNPTTTITLFTGNTGTIPNQTLNAPLYSLVQAPFGMPGIGNYVVAAYDAAATTLTLCNLLMLYVTETPLVEMGYTNSGSAGGTFTFSYTSTGKRVVGLSAATLTGGTAGPGYVVTYPAGFFTSVLMATGVVQMAATTVNQSLVGAIAPTTTGWTFSLWAVGTTTGEAVGHISEGK
jgi:hypothetical protein